MFRQIGAPEIILIIVVIVLLFGAKKLPDLARGSGRALRIFKAETKGLLDEDEEYDVNPSQKTEAQRQIDAQRRAEAAERVEHVQRVEHAEPARPDADR